MLIVETISKIRRAYFVQKKPIKVICRELRVSRKVVRKVIRSEAQVADQFFKVLRRKAIIVMARHQISSGKTFLR
jgi:hypothetical protein